MTIYKLPRELDPVEQRIVGCLLEKELATPDQYPLSVKALTAAANQKSNRDPVMSLEAHEVEDALMRLLPEVLVWRVRSSRVPRWQQNLESKWELGPAGRAVLAELLVRGAQTPGELRTRGSRMHEIASLDEVHDVLDRLGGLGLVAELGRQPGQKEARWTHCLGEAPPIVAVAAPAPRPEAAPGVLDRLDRLERRLDELSATIGTVCRELGVDFSSGSDEEEQE